MHKYFPFLNWLPMAKKTWKEDMIAGMTVTVIAIPQAVAFAYIAGLPPIYGLYSAIVMPIIGALFGSSNQLVSGPTTAISIVVFAAISKVINIDHLSPNYIEVFVSLTLVLGLMAGVIQIIMGVFKMAKIANFVSHTVIIGFTAGAGVLIAFKQLNFVFGLPIPKGSNFLSTGQYLFNHIAEANWYVFVVAISTLVAAISLKKVKYLSRFYMLAAIVLGSVLAYFLGGNSVGIVTVGHIPTNLPKFGIPHLDLETFKLLLSSAFVLALLGAVESVAISKAIALKTHQKLNVNQEFISQGLANITSSLFSGYAGAGSFTRSTINFQAGAKTPMAAIYSSVFIVFILIFVSNLSTFLPLAAMGGIILLVGYSLIDFHHIKRIFKSSKKETLVFFATFFGVIFLNLEYALIIGVVISLFFYLEKTSNVQISILGITESKKFINIARPNFNKVCPQLNIVRIDGSIYFGTIERLREFFNELYDHEQKYVLIVATGINFIDLAGAEWLTYEMKKFRANGGEVVLVGAKLVSQEIFITGGFIEEIGQKSFFDRKNEAIAHVYSLLDKEKCKSCSIKAFDECN